MAGGTQYTDRLITGDVAYVFTSNDPNGVVSGPVGSVARQADGTQWLNTDGATAWRILARDPAVSFVWTQTGPQDPANRVFTSWTDLYAALTAYPIPNGQARYQVLIDGAAVAPYEIPAGTYDMRGGSLCTTFNVLIDTQRTVRLLDGAVLTNLTELNNVILDMDPSATHDGMVITPLSPPLFLKFGGVLRNSSTAGGRLIRVSTGSTYILAAFGGELENPGGGPAIFVESAAVLFVALAVNGIIPVGGLEGTDLTSILVIEAAPSAVFGAPAGTSTLIINGKGDATYLPYAPAVPGNWVAAAPDNVANALDRLVTGTGPV